MKVTIAAASALIAASSLNAQTVATAPPAAVPDLSTAAQAAGTWSYSSAAGGTTATFFDAASRPQLVIRCTRATRNVSISKPASGAAPFLFVWTSSATRNVPASFDLATAQLTATLGVTDNLLDAISFSRGRIGVGVSGAPALVVTFSPEPARVIEDCRV